MFDLMYYIGVVEAIAAGVAALLVPVAAILFVAGRSEAAARALLWAIILAFVSTSGYVVVQWLVGGTTGATGYVNIYVVTKPPSFASKYFPVEITIIPLLPARATYRVVVDWGDGETCVDATVAPQPLTLGHVYDVVGNYTVTVEVYECWHGCGLRTSTSYEIRVSAPWKEIGDSIKGLGENISKTDAGFWTPLYWVAGQLVVVLGGIFESVSDITSKFMADHGIYAGYAFYYYVTIPTSGNFPALASVYDAVRQWALFLLPIALLINILWRAYWEFERGFALLDTVREFVWVLFIVLIGLYIYDAAAEIVNTVGLTLAQLGQLSSLYSMALGFLALTAALGVFSPLAANLAALTAAALIFLVLGGILKWLLAAALAVTIPILAVIWLIPPLRGVASSVASLLAGLFVFTLVAAAFSRLASELSNSLSLTGGGLENLVFAIVMPIVYLVIGPMILQFIGGHLGGYFLPSIRYMLRYGFGVLPMVFPSKMAEQAAPMAMAAVGGAGVATAGATAMGPGGLGYAPGAGGASMATSGIGYLAPVVGITTLRNPVATQLMRQRIVGAVAPGRPSIQEIRHPRLHRTYEIMKGAITGEKPEDLSRREKIAYYAAKYTIGRWINNLRKAGNTFRHRFYMETGIWIPGRLPREHEVRKAAEITYKAGKWIKEKGVVVARKFNSGIRAVTGSVLERQREIRGKY